MINVLMIGVSKQRTGGMWSVAETYINSQEFNKKVNLTYIATSTSGSTFNRVMCMLKGFYKIWKFTRIKKIDVAHVHMAEKGSTFRKGVIIWFLHKKGIKTIVHMHAGPFCDWFNNLNFIYKNCITYFFKSADKIIILGNYWLQQMSSILPKEKLTVLYNSVKTQDNVFNLNSQNIIYMGRINEKKGIWDLLEAIKLIRSNLPKDVNFFIYGEDETGKLSENIVKFGLSEVVHLKGWISGKNKETAFRNAKLLLLPTYTEGLSMTILEAMSYGIPIVTTNITTMPELLDGICTLVEPGDVTALGRSIIELVNSPRSLLKLSRLEYEKFMTSYSLPVMIENTLVIYKSVIES